MGNTLICGNMFAGKTTMALNHKKDSENLYIISGGAIKDILTHDNSISFETIHWIPIVSEGEKLVDTITRYKKSNTNFNENFTIIIDEIHLMDIKSYLYGYNLKNDIIFVGLIRSATNKRYSNTEYLKSLCNEVIEIYPNCSKCSDIGTHVLQINHTKQDILIGGKEFYIPVCKDHYQYLSNL